MALSEWLNATVAIERMFTVFQGAKFDQRKSKLVVKWIIVCLLFVMPPAHIHDPVHRHLIDDIDGDE